jgi:RNA methyltransferase, TrmH family
LIFVEELIKENSCLINQNTNIKKILNDCYPFYNFTILYIHTMMLNKGLIKLVNSLNIKKYRILHGLYVAEGEKLIHDLIAKGAPIKTIITSNDNPGLPSSVEIVKCQSFEIDKISFLKNSPGMIALVKIATPEFKVKDLINKLSIGLDGIRDPGNMGTILRLANWFGIEHIICSQDCVDIYNPKVVQASMGALVGVKVFYMDLPGTIDVLIKEPAYQIYGTFMDGNSVYETNLQNQGLLLMGNEGKGISDAVSQKVRIKISIPAFSQKYPASESLNVAVATGIIISEFVRQSLRADKP